MKKIKIFLLLISVSACVTCGGCADKKAETEQGELVRNETVGEFRQSFLFCKSLRLGKKMVR